MGQGSLAGAFPHLPQSAPWGWGPLLSGGRRRLREKGCVRDRRGVLFRTPGSSPGLRTHELFLWEGGQEGEGQDWGVPMKIQTAQSQGEERAAMQRTDPRHSETDGSKTQTEHLGHAAQGSEGWSQTWPRWGDAAGTRGGSPGSTLMC